MWYVEYATSYDISLTVLNQSTCMSYPDVGSGFQRIFSDDEDDNETQTDYPEHWGKNLQTDGGTVIDLRGCRTFREADHLLVNCLK